MRIKYLLGWLKSFEMGNPEITAGWKKMIFEEENNDFDVVAFRLPKRRSNELIHSIEKMLHDRLN